MAVKCHGGVPEAHMSILCNAPSWNSECGST